MEVFEEGPVPRLIWHLGANSRVPGRLPPPQVKQGEPLLDSARAAQQSREQEGGCLCL